MSLAATSFDNLYIFGDSLSDTGNIFNLTGGAFPPPPYAAGRFSNGDVWVDYLAEDLGLQIDPFTALTPNNDGINFAVGGAQSDAEGVPPLGFGLTQQLGAFAGLAPQLQATGEVFDDDVFALWIGANDYFSFINDDPTTPDVVEADMPRGRELRNTVDEVVFHNIAGTVDELVSSGAANIAIFNLPDLDDTPLGLSLQNRDRNKLRRMVRRHNRKLERYVNYAEDHLYPEVNLVYVDTNELLDDLIRNPGAFDLSNVTDNYTDIDLYTGDFEPSFGAGDPNNYLFFDSVHPSTTVHEDVANLVFAELQDEGLII